MPGASALRTSAGPVQVSGVSSGVIVSGRRAEAASVRRSGGPWTVRPGAQYSCTPRCVRYGPVIGGVSSSGTASAGPRPAGLEGRSGNDARFERRRVARSSPPVFAPLGRVRPSGGSPFPPPPFLLPRLVGGEGLGVGRIALRHRVAGPDPLLDEGLERLLLDGARPPPPRPAPAGPRRPRRHRTRARRPG